MNALCMPGSTRATRPRQMLPTSPRALARSMWSSCTMPGSSIATRVSCGVTLIRISWLIGPMLQHRKTDARERLGGLEQRQAHHPRVAALDPADERRGAPLHGVAARLVVRLAAGDVAL